MIIDKNIHPTQKELIHWQLYPKITFIEAYGNYVKIHFDNSEFQLVRSTLTQLEQALPTDIFCRIHKSTMVNLHQITSYTVINKSIKLLLKSTSSRLSVSRKYASKFKEKYNQLHHTDVIMTRNDPGYVFY